MPLRPRPLAAALTFAALVGSAGLGGASGCITTLAPDIRRELHHGTSAMTSSRGNCLTCHETESHMTRRMKAMTGEEMAAHMRWTETVISPPLVADWMVRDRRGCVECHRVREPRA